MHTRHKLGLAFQARRNWRPRVLFQNGEAGFLGDLSRFDRNRQTYNAPAIPVTAAGDPIGLMLNTAANDDVVNLLLATDDFSNAAWTKRATATVTANTAANSSGVPIADTINTPASSDRVDQSATITGGQTYTLSAEFAGTGTIYIALASSGGTFTSTGTVITLSSTPTRYSCMLATNADNTSVFAIVGRYNGAAGAGTATTFTCSGIQLNLGTTALAYQPNAGSLGGSNRRTGGSNLLLWTENLAMSPWTGFGSAVVNSATSVTLPASAGIYQQTTALASTTYTTQVTLSAAAPVTVRLVLNTNLSDAVTVNCSVTTTPTVFTLSKTTSVGTTTLTTQIDNQTGGSITITATKMHTNIGSTADTYSRNMEVIGGLLTSVVPFQATSGNRGTEARRPKSGIRALNLYTDDITNAAWVKSSASTLATTADAAVAPDGTATADKFYEADTTTADRVIYTSAVVIPAASQNQVVIYAKAAGRGFLQVRMYADNGTFSALIISANLTTGATVASSAVGTATLVSATITDALNGWWRIRLAGSLASDVTSIRCQVFLFNGTVTSYAGVVGNGVYLWRGNVKFGTVDSADQKVVANNDITESGYPDVWHTIYDGVSDGFETGAQSAGTASWFAAASQAWTLEGDYRTVATGVVQTICAKASATAGNRTLMVYIDTDNLMKVNCRGTVTSTGITVTDGVFHIWELRWDGTTLTLWLDGVSYAITVGSAAEEAQNFTIGYRTSSLPASFFNGYNDVLVSIDRGISNAERLASHTLNNNTYRSGLAA